MAETDAVEPVTDPPGDPEAKRVAAEQPVPTEKVGNIAGSVVWAGIGGVVFRLAAVIPAIIVARILSPAEFGVFAVALTVYSVVSSMGELGFGAYVSRNTPDVHEVSPTVSTLCLFAGLLLGGLMFLGAPLLAAAMRSPEATDTIRVMALLVVMVGLFAVPVATMSRTFQQHKVFFATLIAFFVGTPILIIGAIHGLGATSFAWSRVIGTVVVGGILSWFAPQRFGFDRRHLRRLFAFGLPLTAANLISLVLINADSIVISRLLNASELGAYSIAFNLAGWATALMTGMVAVAIPAIGRLAGDTDSVRSTVRNMVQGVCALAFPICAAVSALAAPLVALLYGDKWSGVTPVLIVLPIFGALNLLALLFTNIMIGLSRPLQLFIVQAVWMVVLIPALICGVRVDGIRGAAYAHVGTVVLVVIPLFLWQFHRLFDIGPRILFGAMWRPTVAAASAWAAGILTSQLVSVPLLQLILGGSAGAIVYGSLAWPLISPYMRRVCAGMGIRKGRDHARTRPGRLDDEVSH